jgi:D-alanine-D-alanine ligase
MRVCVLFDDVDARQNARRDESAVMDAVAAVSSALEQLGHSVQRLRVSADLSWLADLTARRPDLVFNLCESVYGQVALEPAAAGVLELLRVPYTGCSAETLAFARRKDRMNSVLAAAGLPVPGWTTVRDRTAPRTWDRFPAIVKPAGEDASVGIHQTSVVQDASELAAVLRDIALDGRLMVQEFVHGREFNVGFIGNDALPVSEIQFDNMPEDYWHIVSWEAKWSAGSPEDLGSVACCPANIDVTLSAYLSSIAALAWQVAEGRGYGRVDLRLDAQDRAWILEVNPNPDLCPAAGLARMASAANIGYPDLIGRIVAEAFP